ncbi:MAG: hypothetical protein ACOYJ2_06005 [Rickettsiales bacterium]
MKHENTSPLTAYDLLDANDKRMVDAYVYRELAQRVSGKVPGNTRPALTQDYMVVDAGVKGIVPNQPAGRGTASYNVEMHIEVMRDVVASNTMFLGSIRSLLSQIEREYPNVDFTRQTQMFIDFNGDEFDAPSEISRLISRV